MLSNRQKKLGRLIMKQHEFLLKEIEWADKMLALPVLPGTLTRAKVNEIRDNAMMDLIPFARYSACGFSHYES